MSMLDLSDIIPFDFIFEMLFGAALVLIDFKAIPYLIQEIKDSYTSPKERVGSLFITLGLIFAPFCLWYNAYVNSPLYEIKPLGFFDFCIWTIVGVPLALLCMWLYGMSNKSKY